MSNNSISKISKAINNFLDYLSAKRLARNKRAIAKAFNNLYTYRFIYDETKPLLKRNFFSDSISGGNAWMCPDCNHVHFPFEYCGIVGIQYPKCCKTPKGPRLEYGIKTN